MNILLHLVDFQVKLLPYDEKYEFPRKKLELRELLGEGQFGKVLKGIAQGIVPWEESTIVAVKMLKEKNTTEYDYLKALMDELKIMIYLGKHINILNVLGACTVNLQKRELLIITECCLFGNIQKYLVDHRLNFVNQIDVMTGKIDYNIIPLNWDSTNHITEVKSPGSALSQKSVHFLSQPKPRHNGSMKFDYLEDDHIVFTGKREEGADIAGERRSLKKHRSFSADQGPLCRANVGGKHGQR